MERQNDKPLISIITPTLNSEIFIEDNIKSILSQTYSNIEHIIIDGGSTDNTIATVRKLDPKAVVLSEPDKGISDAFNKGLELAKGDIITVLNSDDYYAGENVVERVVELFSANPCIKIVYGKACAIEDETGKIVSVYGEPFSIKKMKKRLITPHEAIFAMREVYETIGTFSLKYKIAMDYDYFLRASFAYEPRYIPELLTVMRWGGVSTRNIYLGHREAFKIQRSNGINPLSAFMNLVYRYVMTTLSILLQKVGLKKIVLFYRKQKGML